VNRCHYHTKLQAKMHMCIYLYMCVCVCVCACVCACACVCVSLCSFRQQTIWTKMQTEWQKAFPEFNLLSICLFTEICICYCRTIFRRSVSCNIRFVLHFDDETSACTYLGFSVYFTPIAVLLLLERLCFSSRQLY
jgi:hypothetical protein